MTMPTQIELPDWTSEPPTEPGLYRWRITAPFVYAGFSVYENRRGWCWVEVAHEYGDPSKPLAAFEPGNPRPFRVTAMQNSLWQGPIVVEDAL